ncbi:unnamed protein product [Eretmochelys imbricata]
MCPAAGPPSPCPKHAGGLCISMALSGHSQRLCDLVEWNLGPGSFQGTWARARARASPPLEHSAPALASQPGSRDVHSQGLLAGRGSGQLGTYSPGIGSPGTIHAHSTEDCGAYGEPREPEAEMFKQLPAAQSGAGAAADQGLSLPAEEEILAGPTP